MAESEEVDKIKKQMKENNLSEKLKQLLDNEQLTDKMLSKKPEWVNVLMDSAPSSIIAGNLIASAMSGDKRSIELIQKIAYGDQVTLNAGQGFFDSNEIKIEVIEPQHKKDENI